MAHEIKKSKVQFFRRDDLSLPVWLDPHQVEGVRWILTRSRSYLAHAPGAGKTAQAIVAACFSAFRGRVVIVVPPQLTANWVREILKFYYELRPDAWPSIAVVPVTAKQVYTGWGAEFLIVPDSMITKPWVLRGLNNLKIRMLVVDEASRFKDHTAQRTIALFGGRLKDGTQTYGLAASGPQTVLMDGSPMPNRPIELWAPTYALSPETIDYMSYNDFGLRYCGATVNDYGQFEFRGSSHESELRLRLRGSFMHVVGEGELNHPERKRTILFMTKDARSREHKSWEKKHLSTLKLSDISEDASRGDIARFRSELGMRKVPWIADYVADLLSRKNESILLFAWHREVVFALSEKLKKFDHATIMGGTTTRDREDAFSKFQAGKIKLLIMNIAAGGRGHNLQRADRVVFGEYSWGNETNIQCEKRASRRGNEKAFTRCEYVVSPNSMDELVLNSVFQKETRVRKVIG